MPRKSRSSTATPRSAIPMPCKVHEDAKQRPVAVTLLGETLSVESIEERWENEEGWWKDNPLVRVTYEVTFFPAGGRQGVHRRS